MAEPVAPPTVGIPDLRVFLDELGATSHPADVDSYELALHDGLRLDVHEDADIDRDVSYVQVCSADLETTRSTITERYGAGVAISSDSVDPQTGRMRAVVFRTAALVVTAVHCPAAADTSIPCRPDCSPHA